MSRKGLRLKVTSLDELNSTHGPGDPNGGDVRREALSLAWLIDGEVRLHRA